MTEKHHWMQLGINQNYALHWDPEAVDDRDDQFPGCFVPVTEEPDAIAAYVVKFESKDSEPYVPGQPHEIVDLTGKPLVAPIPLSVTKPGDNKGHVWFDTRANRTNHMRESFIYEFPRNMTVDQYVARPVVVQAQFDFDTSVYLKGNWSITFDTSEILDSAVVAYSVSRGPPSVYTRTAILVATGILRNIPSYQFRVDLEMDFGGKPDSVSDVWSFGFSGRIGGSISVVSTSVSPPRAMPPEGSEPLDEDYVVVGKDEESPNPFSWWPMMVRRTSRTGGSPKPTN